MIFMQVLVLDTNIIQRSAKQEDKALLSLCGSAAKWGLKILVPDVCFMECVNNIRKKWGKYVDTLESMHFHDIDRSTEAQELIGEFRNRASQYEKFLKGRFGELNIEVFELPSIDHLEIARRAAETVTPYRGEKDGYRDTLIWFTLLDIAKKYPSSDVWFVSDNTSDFGPRGNNWTGPGQGSRTDCPINFHHDLADELKNEKLSKRIHYVVDLGILEQHLAAQHSPLTDDELKKYLDHLTASGLSEYFAQAVRGHELDIERAALDLDALEATIGDDVEVHDWHFADAAHRGTDGLTANFTVDADVEINIDKHQDFFTETKTLRFRGTLHSYHEEEVYFEISTIETLPGDPQRVVWDNYRIRRAADMISSLEVPLPPELFERFRSAGTPVSELAIRSMFKSLDAETLESLKRMRESLGRVYGTAASKSRRNDLRPVQSEATKPVTSDEDGEMDGEENSSRR